MSFLRERGEACFQSVHRTSHKFSAKFIMKCTRLNADPRMSSSACFSADLFSLSANVTVRGTMAHSYSTL
jgi:hypothetical protein